MEDDIVTPEFTLLNSSLKEILPKVPHKQGGNDHQVLYLSDSYVSHLR